MRGFVDTPGLDQLIKRRDRKRKPARSCYLQGLARPFSPHLLSGLRTTSHETSPALTVAKNDARLQMGLAIGQFSGVGMALDGSAADGSRFSAPLCARSIPGFFASARSVMKRRD